MPNWDLINNGYSMAPYDARSAQLLRAQNGMPTASYNTYNQVPATQQIPQNGYSQAPMPTTNIIWTQGISGAKAEPVSPGCQKWMLDSESMRFFIKSVDPSGIPLPLRRFRYVEETGPEDEGKSGSVDTSQFMTKDQFKQEFKSMLEEYLGPVKK